MENYDKSKTPEELTLHWDVFITPGIPIVTRDRPSDVSQTFFQATAVTLIRDFDRLAASTQTAQELYDAMLKLYPNRVNPGWALWSSARAIKP